MSNTLTKDILVTVLSPGTPATPGSPGSPGSPAWDEVIDKYVECIVGDSYVWNIGSTTHVYNVFFYPLSDITGSSAFPATDTSLPGSGVTVSTIPIYGTVHIHTIIHHDAVPAVPPTPGTPGTPADVVTNYQIGWSGSADSIGSIATDGQFKFSVDSNTIGVFVGLSDIAVGTDYKRLAFGLYFTDRKVEVWESGVNRAASTTFTTSDVFAIRRLGPEVAYYKGSTLLYRSTVTSSGPLTAYADLYAGGDTIINASIDSTVDTALSGTTPGVLSISVPQPIFWASEKDGLLNVSVPAPRIWATDDGRATIAVPAGVVSILGADFAGLSVSVPAPAVDIEGDLETPVYGILQTLAPYPSMYMSVDVISGSMNISVPPPKFLAWEGDGILQVTVPQPKFWALDVGGIGIINASLPSLTASMDGQVWPDYFNLGIRATLPALTFSVNGGDHISAVLPSLTASLTGTAHNYGVLTATLPKLTAALTGSAGSFVTIAATLPSLTAHLASGSSIGATLPSLTAVLAGTSHTVASVVASMPEFTASMSGFAGSSAALSATLPRFLAGANYNAVTASLRPLRVLLAQNDASFVVTDAYATTISNPKKPVTRYTNYPFHSIIRLGDRYLGFGPTGAFNLAGSDDAGTPIAWSFKFGPTVENPEDEFGQNLRKDNRGVYFMGRFSKPVTLSVAVDDGTAYTYTKTQPWTTMDTLRFIPGKGLRGFAWQFGLSGTGTFDVHRAEFLQKTLQRKVKHG